MMKVLFSRAQGASPTVLDILGGPLHQHVRDNVRAYASGGGAAEGVLVLGRETWLSTTAVDALLSRAAGSTAAVCVVAVNAMGAGSPGEACAIYYPSEHSASPALKDGDDVPTTLAELTERADPVRVSAMELDWADPPRYVRSIADRADVERAVIYGRALALLRGGVRVRDPRNLLVRGVLTCGANVEIDANVIIEGAVTLGEGVRIGSNVSLTDCTIGERTLVRAYSLVEKAEIGADSAVGPYGRIRPGSIIGDSVMIGNFVEIKNSTIGAGGRISHLAFVGDSTLGKSVTIGAGTITCNHNWGKSAHTHIGDGAYIGSGCELIAPLTIGENATVGAGSTITSDVEPGKLAIARSKQVVVARWKRPPEPPGGDGDR